MGVTLNPFTGDLQLITKSLQAGGTDKQVQFNDGGTLNGLGSWDKTTGILDITLPTTAPAAPTDLNSTLISYP